MVRCGHRVCALPQAETAECAQRPAKRMTVGEPAELDSHQAWPDQRAEYDAMRARCPVAWVDGELLVLGHREVTDVANHPALYASSVTDRRAIPNSLDGADHAAYREVVDRYLTAERVAELEPGCRDIATQLVGALPRGDTVKTIADLGTPYAVRAQSAWLGWPRDLETELVAWMAENHAATRSGDRSRTGAVADRFDGIIRSMLNLRRSNRSADVTSELMADTVHGRPLTDEEIVSIMRNWTAGDLGSLATSVGVVVHHLATNRDVQTHVRSLVSSRDVAGLEAAVEEVLRIDDPFVSNRRRATRDATLAGHTVPAGTRVVVNWTAANRDPAVFGDPDSYAPDDHAAANLVFGTGPHVCPGRALTLMELRVVVTALLEYTTWIEPAPDRPAVRETPPVGGWARVPVVLR